MSGVVIVGAGQAGFQTATSLRGEGFTGPITLIGDEPELPYNRPPLSKGFLLGKETEDDLPFRPAAYFAEHRITMRMGVRAVEVNRDAKLVRLDSGLPVPYDFLVLATGAQVRALGAGWVEGLLYLRSSEDARECKWAIEDSESVIVIGAGFIGLEVAAAAASLGRQVVVVAAEDRPMSRVVSPLISQYFRRLHESRGVRLLLDEKVARVERGVRVHLKSGEVLAAPAAIAGLGVVPNTGLATACGLDVGDGIAVDEYLRTNDAAVFAIGDCAEHPNRFALTGRCRLESIQNSVDMARCVASTIAGKPRTYEAVPWFWTEQFDTKLQITGIPTSCDQFVMRGDPESSAFSVFGFRDGRLDAVESVNRPVDHIHARKLLEMRTVMSPVEAADPAYSLKQR